jgi:putative hemolysin
MTEPIDIILTAALATCFVSAAVLAVAEVSLIRVRRSAVMVEADQGNARAQHLLNLLDELPVVLNTVLLLVLLFQVGAAAIAAFLAQSAFGGIGVTIASVGVTAVLFIYAEAIPKSMAVKAPQRFAMSLTPLLRAVLWPWRPLVAFLLRMANLQTRGDQTLVGALTESELRALARESAAVGEIDSSDATLVERSFEFGDRCVGEVMVERAKIVAIAVDEPVGAALSKAIESGHRRLPVYQGGLDDIVGVVRLRDAAAAVRTSPHSRASEVMIEVLRCVAEYPIASLLQDMQAASVWMAVVETPDGHTLGLATMEDLVAELVGEIEDGRATVRRPSGPRA